MINIVYQHDPESFYQLRVEGHAGHAAYGQDIVCAGVSSLVQALAYRAGEVSESCHVDLSNGFAAITTDHAAAECFDTVMTGLRLIAMHYPDKVKILEG